MSEIIAGDIRLISVQNGEVGKNNLEGKATEDVTMDLGGFSIDDDQQSVTSFGTHIVKKNRKLWKVETTIGANEGDLNYLQSLVKSGVPSSFTFELANGERYSGSGRMVGDIAANFQAGTIPVVFQGGGRLIKQ